LHDRGVEEKVHQESINMGLDGEEDGKENGQEGTNTRYEARHRRKIKKRTRAGRYFL